jgi:hypothetical protein
MSKSDRRLDTSQVPSNESQAAAVLGLGGGLDIVHGTLLTQVTDSFGHKTLSLMLFVVHVVYVAYMYSVVCS